LAFSSWSTAHGYQVTNLMVGVHENIWLQTNVKFAEVSLNIRPVSIRLKYLHDGCATTAHPHHHHQSSHSKWDALTEAVDNDLNNAKKWVKIERAVLRQNQAPD
jgi:hypothetical protein